MEEQEQSIDLMDLLKVFQNNFIAIMTVTAAASVIGFVLAMFIVPKKYTSETLLYVENSSSKSEESSININDINAAQKLVNTCQILFTSNYILDELSVSLDRSYTAAELKKMITVSSVNNTEVLKISAVSNSPDDSFAITAKMNEFAKKEFIRVIKNGSIETVSEPTYPLTHTFPSTLKFTAAAFMIGLAGSYFVFLVIELTDVKVKPEDDLSQMYDIPVFAEILDFTVSNESGYKESKYSSGYDYESYS